MNYKFWFVLCLLFGAYNLKQLIDDFYLLNYMIVEPGDRLYDETTNYLLCTPFREIGSNNELEFRPPALRDVPAVVLLNYSIQAIEKKLNHSNLFRLNESFISRDNVCFSIEKADLEASSTLDSYIHNYQPILFMFSPSTGRFFSEYVFYQNKNNDVKTFFLKVQKQKVFSSGYLSRPTCSQLKNQFTSSRFNCLNRCFIQSKLEIGFYGSQDAGSFNLEAFVNNKSLTRVDVDRPTKTAKRSIQAAADHAPKKIPIKFIQAQTLLQGFDQNFERCLSKCPDPSCFYEIYNAVRIRRFYYCRFQREQDKIDLKSFTYLAYYSTSDWFLQFFGLLTLFTNTTVFDLSCFCIVLLAKRLGKEQHRCFVSVLRPLKLLLMALSVAFISIRSIWMVQDYLFVSAYPNRTSILKFTSEFEPFSMVVCFPVETIINHEKELREGRNYSFTHKINSSFEDLKSLTDDGLNRKTGGLFVLLYGFYRKPFDWKVRSNVIFKNITCDHRPCLARCFWIDIRLQETRYDLLLPTNSLLMNFRTEHWRVYLIDRDLPFTSAAQPVRGELYISKLVREHSAKSKKSNCKNYPADPTLNCQTQKNCIDKCVTKRYLERHSALPLFSIVDMEDLDSSDYRKQFSAIREPDIERQCSDLFPAKDCTEVYFFENLKTSYAFQEKRITINLNFEKITVKEFKPSLLKVMLDIVNLESIFFSVSAADLLMCLFSCFKHLFKIKWREIYRFPILFACAVGFVLHNVSTFNGIINEPLVEDSAFEKLTNLKLPNSIFCFYFNDTQIDENRKLTQRYLDDHTRTLSYEKIFDFVWYGL